MFCLTSSAMRQRWTVMSERSVSNLTTSRRCVTAAMYCVPFRRMDAAVTSYERAIELRPDYAEALNNLGNALAELNQLDASLARYDRALKIKPDYVDALNNRGNASRDMKRPDAALKSYGRALELDSEFKFLYGTWLEAKMQVCDWSGIECG